MVPAKPVTPNAYKEGDDEEDGCHTKGGGPLHGVGGMTLDGGLVGHGKVDILSLFSSFSNFFFSGLFKFGLIN